MTRTHQASHAAAYLWSGSCSHEGTVSKLKRERGTHSVYRLPSCPHCLKIWGKDKRPPAYKGKKKKFCHCLPPRSSYCTNTTPFCCELPKSYLFIKIF